METELKRWAAPILILVMLACGGGRDAEGVEDHARTEAAAADRERLETTRLPAGVQTGSREAAVAVLRAYYAAITTGNYAAAYAKWASRGAASGQSFEEFRRGYAHTRSVEVSPGTPGRIEPAAGSRYVEVPVQIRATSTEGARQCFHGTYTLVRSVVTGGTARQRHWHIYSAQLERCPS